MIDELREFLNQFTDALRPCAYLHFKHLHEFAPDIDTTEAGSIGENGCEIGLHISIKGPRP